MGCWNKTCGLTRLHINAGDPVYVFALEKNNYHGRCYSTAFWRPCVLIWEAEYNGYGAGENDKGIGVNYVVNGIKRQLVEVGQGENPYHDIPVKRDKFDLELFYEAVHEGRLNIQDHFRENPEVDFVMMRKSAVDSLLNTWEIKDCYLDDNRDLVYFTYGYDDLVDKIPEYVAEVKEAYESDDISKRFAPDWCATKGPLSALKNFIADSSMSYSKIVNVKMAVTDLIEDENNTEAAAELLEYALKGTMLSAFFERTRRNWAPAGHEGSQDNDLDAHEFLLDIVKEEIAHERTKREEY